METDQIARQSKMERRAGSITRDICAQILRGELDDLAFESYVYVKVLQVQRDAAADVAVSVCYNEALGVG